ncbi:MAG: N-acetylglucosamine-6-phosphate deacetylase [Saccharofermentanales bacterium]
MYIKNARIINEKFEIQSADLVISETIDYIIPTDECEDVISGGRARTNERRESTGQTAWMDESTVDFCGDLLIPGLIDIHTHGALGMDSMSESLDFGLWRQYMLKNGITTFFPTTVTENDDAIERAIRNLADADGIYLEGPYINPDRNGAHDKRKIHPVDAFLDRLDGKLRIVALAPEYEANMDAIKALTARGVRVSLGHSAADYETGKRAFNQGATQLVHTFNAMNPLSHREPNLIGAAFDDDRVFCEVISDGVHLHPAIVRMLYRLLGARRMVLISDSMAATGLADGEYGLGDLRVTVKDHVARTEYGAIAGSTKNIMEMMRTAVSFGIPLAAAVEMASLTPARAAGIDGDVGSISKGKIANLVRCTDDLGIKSVIYKGRMVRI